jgi:hypothetical protein
MGTLILKEAKEIVSLSVNFLISNVFTLRMSNETTFKIGAKSLRKLYFFSQIFQKNLEKYRFNQNF